MDVDQLHLFSIEEDAATRRDSHAGRGTRLWVENPDLIGLSGEWAFAKAVGRVPSTYTEERGDGGIDFRINLSFSVDVKTATSRYGLMVEVGKVNADIYVLALNEAKGNTAELIGWATRSDVLACEPKTVRGGDVHHIPLDQLKPIDTLLKRVHKD